MSSHKFWEGLFDTVDIGFVLNLYKHQLSSPSKILMTCIVPQGISNTKYDLLLLKENKLKNALLEYGAAIEFFHIQGRNVFEVFKAVKGIKLRIQPFTQKFIWAKNYYNSFISVLIKLNIS